MSTSPHHTAAQCRSSKHTRVQHLITADEGSLAELSALVATLPICSTGRIFVEVPDASWIADLAVPGRMTVTWLDRASRTGAPGSGRGCGAGDALSRAVIAWADEMLCPAAADEDQTRIHLLGGFLGTADIFDHLTQKRGIPAVRVHTPERFGLISAL